MKDTTLIVTGIYGREVAKLVATRPAGSQSVSLMGSHQNITLDAEAAVKLGAFLAASALSEPEAPPPPDAMKDHQGKPIRCWGGRMYA